MSVESNLNLRYFYQQLNRQGRLRKPSTKHRRSTCLCQSIINGHDDTTRLFSSSCTTGRFVSNTGVYQNGFGNIRKTLKDATEREQNSNKLSNLPLSYTMFGRKRPTETRLA